MATATSAVGVSAPLGVRSGRVISTSSPSAGKTWAKVTSTRASPPGGIGNMLTLTRLRSAHSSSAGSR